MKLNYVTIGIAKSHFFFGLVITIDRITKIYATNVKNINVLPVELEISYADI